MSIARSIKLFYIYINFSNLLFINITLSMTKKHIIFFIIIFKNYITSTFWILLKPFNISKIKLLIKIIKIQIKIIKVPIKIIKILIKIIKIPIKIIKKIIKIKKIKKIKMKIKMKIKKIMKKKSKNLLRKKPILI